MKFAISQREKWNWPNRVLWITFVKRSKPLPTTRTTQFIDRSSNYVAAVASHRLTFALLDRRFSTAPFAPDEFIIVLLGLEMPSLDCIGMTIKLMLLRNPAHRNPPFLTSARQRIIASTSTCQHFILLRFSNFVNIRGRSTGS